MWVIVRPGLRLYFSWSVRADNGRVAKMIVYVRSRSRGTTQRANLAHAPRHHKSRPRLGQGSEVRVSARVRKRHVSTVRSVGGYRVMCLWRPADVMPGLAVDQCVCFRSRRVSMLSLVLWTIPRGTMRAVGYGTWSGVRASRPPFPFLLLPLSQYAGTYPECSRILVEHVTTSTGRSARNYEGGGVWYVVGGPCQSPPLSLSLASPVPVRRDVSGVLQNIGRARNYLDGSLP